MEDEFFELRDSVVLQLVNEVELSGFEDLVEFPQEMESALGVELGVLHEVKELFKDLEQSGLSEVVVHSDVLFDSGALLGSVGPDLVGVFEEHGLKLIEDGVELGRLEVDSLLADVLGEHEQRFKLLLELHALLVNAVADGVVAEGGEAGEHPVVGESLVGGAKVLRGLLFGGGLLFVFGLAVFAFVGVLFLLEVFFLFLVGIFLVDVFLVRGARFFFLVLSNGRKLIFVLLGFLLGFVLSKLVVAGG